MRDHQRDVYDPKNVASHRDMAREAAERRRSGHEPDWLPTIPPVAARPQHAVPILNAFRRINAAKRAPQAPTAPADDDGIPAEQAPTAPPTDWQPTRISDPAPPTTPHR